ncbi:MAG TPA: hypothetical protein VMS60_13535 [Solirubrobacterales bacterium]|nr:hypothetical protein [Solirubrobacterales bacterium]
MNGRKAIAGLCMLCALLASAFAAQSASAITGTTAVTCKSGLGDTGKQTWADSHCKTGASGPFGHYKIAENTTTELTVRAGSEASKFKATLGGVAVTFTSTSLTGTGSMENKVDDPTGEHFVHATGAIVFSGVTVSPFTKCFVYTDDGTTNPGAQGVIDTEELTLTTREQGDAIKGTPKTGNVFARFWIGDKNKVVTGGGECTIAGTYLLTGSTVFTPEGATLAATHNKVTEQNTLKLGTGETTIKAGFEGSLTIEASAKGAGAFNPISFTTYPT